MSIGAFFNALPGIAAQGLAGRNAAEAETFRRRQLEEESARRNQALAMEESLLKFRTTPQPMEPPTPQVVQLGNGGYDILVNGQRTGGREPAAPQTPRQWKEVTRNVKGKPVRVAVDLATGEEKVLGEEYRAPSGGAAPGDKPMPVALKERVVKTQGALENLDLALGALRDETGGVSKVAQEAFGSAQMLRGAPSILGMMATRKLDTSLPSPARQMRAQIASVSSTLLNLLSGAAISPKEYERLSQYVPDINRDAPETIEDKLKNLRRELAGTLARYQSGPPATENLPTSENMSAADYYDALIDNGASPDEARRQTELKYGPPPE